MERKKLKLKKLRLYKDADELRNIAANELLENEEAQQIIYGIRNAKK